MGNSNKVKYTALQTKKRKRMDPPTSFKWGSQPEYALPRYARIFVGLFNGVSSLFSRYVPCWNKLINSSENEHVLTKTCLRFIYGLFLGILMYEVILIDLQFGDITVYILSAFICLTLAFGNAFSKQIRCMSLLSIPSFCDKTGQTVLTAMVIAYLIAGPITNMTDNSKEVVRVFACSTTLTYNLTRNRFSLMFKPFKDALLSMRADTSGVKDTISSIRGIVNPIKQELEGDENMQEITEENDYLEIGRTDSQLYDEINQMYNESLAKSRGEKIDAKYIRKLHVRCEGMISRASAKCYRTFENAFDSCWQKLHWAVNWALCWPMKLDFICNTLSVFGSEKICDPRKIIGPGVGKGFQYLEKSTYELKEGFKRVKVQLEIEKVTAVAEDAQDAYSTAKAITREFHEKQRIVEFLLKFTNRILAFSFLRIILSVSSYITNYLTDIEFDNEYITKYFRIIDARRRQKGRHTLLPLKKIERYRCIDLYNLKISAIEKKVLHSSLLKAFVELIFASSIVFLDFLYYEALIIVQSQARIEYSQEGHHKLFLDVQGTGMIASLIRSIVKGFKINKRVKHVISNEECLPRPSQLKTYYYVKIYGAFFIIILLAISNAYTKRLNRLIAGYFYRKREKRRILFLYNEILRKRIIFFRHRLAKVKKLAAENKLSEDFNVFIVLRLRFPRLFWWFAECEMGQRHCLICREAENEGAKIRCGNPKCQYVYCPECWEDVKHICYGCTPTKMSAHDEHNQDSFSEQTD